MRIHHPMLKPRSNKSISFTFNNDVYEGREGETIGVALWANRIKTLRTSEKNNEPRGMYCGIGQCYECRIYHAEIGLVKACTTLIQEGGSYYSFDKGNRGCQSGGENVKCDVVIVGGGPAGLAAAIELGERGGDVIVVDDHPTLGGKLLGQLHEEGNSRNWWKGRELAESLAQKVQSVNVSFLNGKQVWGLEKGWKVYVSDLTKNEPGITIEAKCVLLATGAVEKPVPFPGWTLPGVISIGAAQVMTNVYGVLPGKRVIVAGIDILSLSIARSMKLAGADVLGVYILPNSPFSNNLSPLSQLEGLRNLTEYAPSWLIRKMGLFLQSEKGRKFAAKFYPAKGVKIWGIPVYIRQSLLSVNGNREVESVSIVRIDVDGTPNGKPKSLNIDSVCISGGLTPLYELAATVGCKFVYLEGLSGIVPLHGIELQTNVPNLFVAGNITGIESAKVALAQGSLAGKSICKQLNLGKVNDKEIKESIANVQKVRESSKIKFHPKIQEARKELDILWKQYNLNYS